VSAGPQPFSPELLPAETRIACRIEYDGHAFNGWQSQPHPGAVTVQDELEAALVGGNTALRGDIRIHWAVPVDRAFHARYSARARCYRYVIANTVIAPALLRDQVAWHRRPLDAPAMDRAAQALLGERDFSAFRAASCQSASPMRNVVAISVRRRGDLVVLDIVANAFLHHMVRNIAGALLAVGDGRKPAQWVGQLLAGRDRTRGADTAPARGLYLAAVEYPDYFGLPATPYGPPLLAASHSEP